MTKHTYAFYHDDIELLANFYLAIQLLAINLIPATKVDYFDLK